MQIVYIDLDDIKNPLLGAGQAKATLEAGKELVKLGHSVTVYCSKYPGCEDRIQSGIHYKHIGISTPNIKLNNLLFLLFAPWTVSNLDPDNVDIIIESFAPPFSTLFSPLFTKIPVVGLPSMFNATEFKKKYHLPFLEKIEAWGCRHYTYFLPYSDIDSGKMKTYNPNIIFKIVGQGVGEEFFKIKHKKAKHILFLGRLDMSQKGIDILLEAYKKVEKEIRLPLVIAGHGPDEEKIKSMIKELKLESKVTLAGSTYGDKKKKLIEEALYVAFPSRHDEMSLWALEAIASGQPMVCFDLPESKWLPKTVSLKAKPFSITEYASLLVKGCDVQVIEKLRDNCRPFAKKFSWRQVAMDFTEFFESILERERELRLYDEI